MEAWPPESEAGTSETLLASAGRPTGTSKLSRLLKLRRRSSAASEAPLLGNPGPLSGDQSPVAGEVELPVPALNEPGPKARRLFKFPSSPGGSARGGAAEAPPTGELADLTHLMVHTIFDGFPDDDGDPGSTADGPPASPSPALDAATDDEAPRELCAVATPAAQQVSLSGKLGEYASLLMYPRYDPRKRVPLAVIREASLVQQRRRALFLLTCYLFLVRFASPDLFVVLVVASNAGLLYLMFNARRFNTAMAKRAFWQRVGWAKQFVGGVFGRNRAVGGEDVLADESLGSLGGNGAGAAKKRSLFGRNRSVSGSGMAFDPLTTAAPTAAPNRRAGGRTLFKAVAVASSAAAGRASLPTSPSLEKPLTSLPSSPALNDALVDLLDAEAPGVGHRKCVSDNSTPSSQPRPPPSLAGISGSAMNLSAPSLG